MRAGNRTGKRTEAAAAEAAGSGCPGASAAKRHGAARKPGSPESPEARKARKARKPGSSPPMASGERRRSTHGERSEAPTGAGAAAGTMSLFFLVLFFAAVAYRRQRRRLSSHGERRAAAEHTWDDSSSGGKIHRSGTGRLSGLMTAAAAAKSTAAAPRKAHWRAQRSPTPKKQLFCCAAVLLSFVGPAFGRAGFGIAAAATAAETP